MCEMIGDGDYHDDNKYKRVYVIVITISLIRITA